MYKLEWLQFSIQQSNNLSGITLILEDWGSAGPGFESYQQADIFYHLDTFYSKKEDVEEGGLDKLFEQFNWTEVDMGKN